MCQDPNFITTEVTDPNIVILSNEYLKEIFCSLFFKGMPELLFAMIATSSH